MRWLKLLLIAALLAGIALCLAAQIAFPQVKIVASTYENLNATGNNVMSQPMILESKLAKL